MRGHPQRLADREDADGNHHHIDAVGKLGEAEGQPLLTGHLVDADQPDHQSEQQRREATDPRRAQDRRRTGEGQQHDRQIVRRSQADRELHHLWRDQGQQQRPDRPGHEGPDRGGRQRLRGPAGPGHLVAFDRRHHRGRLARRVQQDRGRRAAVHAAVEDPGEEDERLHRLQPVRDRQQQRDRHRRSDPRQHTDRRTDGHPEQRK
jgi:hypothetical protein